MRRTATLVMRKYWTRRGPDIYVNRCGNYFIATIVNYSRGLLVETIIAKSNQPADLCLFETIKHSITCQTKFKLLTYM